MSGCQMLQQCLHAGIPEPLRRALTLPRKRPAPFLFIAWRRSQGEDLGPSLALAILSCPLELRDPGTGEVVSSCRPSLTGDSLLKTATSSGVKLKH
jgi:hypothetical protein